MVLTVEPPSSNPPAGASQRLRPLDTPPSSGEVELELGVAEHEPAPTTKSPESQRVVKRARFTSPGPDAHADAPFLASSSPPLPSLTLPPTLRSPEETAFSTSPLPATSRVDMPADQLKHLESLVDSVLATVVIIQATSTQPVILSPHTRRALELLNKFVAPTPATTCSVLQSKPRGPTTPSYAQATKGSHATHPVEHTVKPSPAGHKPSRSRAHSQSSQQPCHSAYRLIVRWPGHPVPQSSNSLQNFISSLKKRVRPYYQRHTCLNLELAGANVTRSGNIVIHTKAPHTASQLLDAIQLSGIEDVTHAGEHIPGFICPIDILPEIELDKPWFGVVIHNIPAQPLLESYQGREAMENLWDVVPNQTGLPPQDIRDIRVLCREEDLEKRDRLSIRIMLDDQRLSEHLCRDDVFFFKTPCRVSRYRPRKNRRRPSPSS